MQNEEKIFDSDAFEQNLENLPVLVKENPDRLYRSFLSSPFIAFTTYSLFLPFIFIIISSHVILSKM